MAIPRNAQPGIKLPKIGGLRLRRNVKTGKYGMRDVIVGPDGKAYGLAAPGQFQIGFSGTGADRFLSLVRKPKKPKTGVGPNPPSPTTPTTPKPPPDEYASYDRDYPWIASYLRALRNEETNFNKRYTEQIQPGVAAGLESLGKIGEGIARTYGAQIGTPGNAGTVSNIYGAAANITPAQVASGLGGGGAQVYDPNAVAARQGMTSAQSSSAQADARYRSLFAGLQPVSTAQGILGGLATSAAAISKSYADKRMSERVKLDQWIAEQKASAADRQIRQQYNMALLGIKKDELALDRQQFDLDVEQARNEGVKTDTQLASEGFIKFEPEKIGPKNRAAAQRRAVRSREGTLWWKPGGGSKPGGSGGPTASQRAGVTQDLYDAYFGKQVTDPATGALRSSLPGFRSSPDWNTQPSQVASFIVGRGDLIKDRSAAAITNLLEGSIGGNLQRPKPGGVGFDPVTPAQRKWFFNKVIQLLRQQGFIVG